MVTTVTKILVTTVTKILVTTVVYKILVTTVTKILVTTVVLHSHDKHSPEDEFCRSDFILTCHQSEIGLTRAELHASEHLGHFQAFVSLALAIFSLADASCGLGTRFSVSGIVFHQYQPHQSFSF